MFTKRSKIDVMYAILETVKRHNPETRITQILYKSNLNSSLLKTYVDFLVENNMLKTRMVNEKSLYNITEKGKGFIKTYEHINNLINKGKQIESEIKAYI